MNSGEGLTYSTLINSLIMVVTGSINALASKFQSNLGFNYGLSITFQMFFGEYLNYLALVIPIAFNSVKRAKHMYALRQAAAAENKKLEVSMWRLGLGGFFDLFGSGLQTIAIFLMPASIWQMLRNATVIFVVFFTLTYLKKRVLVHNWVAVGIAMLGFSLVGLASLVGDDSDAVGESKSFVNSLIGLALLLVSLVFSGFQFAYQEGLIDSYEFDPRRIVGAESIVGTVSLTFFLFITANIKCPNPSMCTTMIDDPSESMLVMFNDGRILAWATCSALSIMIYNLTGIHLTKNVSCVFRIIIDSIRTIVIWIFGVIFGLETFLWPRFFLQAPGFILLIIGNLVYNEIIVISYFGLDRDVKKKP